MSVDIPRCFPIEKSAACLSCIFMRSEPVAVCETSAIASSVALLSSFGGKICNRGSMHIVGRALQAASSRSDRRELLPGDAAASSGAASRQRDLRAACASNRGDRVSAASLSLRVPQTLEALDIFRVAAELPIIRVTEMLHDT